MELLNHSGDTSKKSPMCYLELEAHQNRNFLNEKNINKFVDDATKNINLSERLAMYSILKYVILNTGYEKKLMSNSKNGDNFSMNVLISSKKIENNDFNKAEIIFED